MCFVPVVSCDHALATLEGPIDQATLERHLRLVVKTSRKVTLVSRQEEGRRLRLGDSALRNELVRQGVRWAYLAKHEVARVGVGVCSQPCSYPS